MNNRYGFTTKPDDNFIRRVAAEAKPRQRFIVAASRDVADGSQSLTIMVRESALPPKKAGFKLGGTKLGKTGWGTKIRGTDFRMLTVPVESAIKSANVAFNEIQRIKNYLDQKTLRVTVGALLMPGLKPLQWIIRLIRWRDYQKITHQQLLERMRELGIGTKK